MPVMLVSLSDAPACNSAYQNQGGYFVAVVACGPLLVLLLLHTTSHSVYSMTAQQPPVLSYTILAGNKIGYTTSVTLG